MGDFPLEAAWHFVGIMLVIFFAALYGRAGRAGSFWLIACRFPGTVLHELAHYVVGFVTGGRPVGFTVIPVRRDSLCADGAIRREWVLGAVTLRNPGPLAVLPTALAPLLLLGAAWFAYIHWFEWFPHGFRETLGLYGTLGLFCCGSIPSGQDLRVGFSSLTGVAVYTLLAVAAFCFFRL